LVNTDGNCIEQQVYQSGRIAQKSLKTASSEYMMCQSEG